MHHPVMSGGQSTLPLIRRFVLALLCVTIPALVSRAQTAPAPDAATLAKYDKNQNGQIDPEEEAARKADAGNDVLELSPFQVKADNNGYHASNTLSGTRLNTRLEDLASSITVVTKQQLVDTASVDINDIFLYEANTEGMYQYTEYVQDRGFYNETTTLNPQSANRVRGVGAANMARGNFAASSSVPVDTYNIESVEISRGPNANIFGLGNASGTVNLLTIRANTQRDFNQVTLRGDSYGGWRTNFDVNQSIVKDKLAFRVAGLHEEKGFVRDPSFERINRLTAAYNIQPFKKTQLTGSYEYYRNSYNRGNTTLPRDVFSEWEAAGMPVWNPGFGTTGGWRLLNSSTYTAVSAANEANAPTATANGFPLGLYPNFNSFWARPSAFTDNGSIERFEMARNSTTNAPGFNGARRYAETGGIYRRGGNAFGVPPLILYQVPSIADKSEYDYESINFLAPNFGRDEAEISQVELEQVFLSSTRQQLALQLGFYRENISRFDHSFLSRTDGATPMVSVDVNEFYLDGTANPYFLRPYIFATEPQVKFTDEFNDNYRATLAYQLDLSEEGGWKKWLGLHRFAAYGEERNLKTRSLGGREQVVSDHPWVTGNNALSLPIRGAEYHLGMRYYVGGKVTDPGPIIDYAPSAPGNIPGTLPFIWYGNSTTTPTIDTVKLDSVISSGSTRQRKISTKGIIWQGFLWNDKIIPTFGWREDKQKERVSRSLNSNPPSATQPNSTIDPVTRLHDLSYLDIFPTPWVENEGRTKTKGVVIKPLKWLSLHYNESDSFVPEPIRWNILLEQLSNPTGNGKDYGFSVNLFDGKLVAKVNKYKTVELNSRSGTTGGAFAQRTFRFFFDPATPLTLSSTTNTYNNSLDPFDLEQVGAQWFRTLDPSLSGEAARVKAVDTYLKPFGFDQAYMDRVREIGGGSFAEVNTVTSKGIELELNYNPTRYWTLKLTAAQQEAVDTELSNNANKFFDENLDALKAIKDPTNGSNWWSTNIGSGSTASPENWFFVNILTTLTQASANAGKPRPQTREWRFAATTNFKLSGITDHKYFKNLSVGGSLRWEDKAVLGYYGAAPLANGAIVDLDPNRPIYDPARTYVDLLAIYDLKMFDDRVKARLQLNVRNAFENGRLQAFVFNPDGVPWNYRIIDPRQFILSATFDF
ncbi:MAG TPA: TonB-dependent receptor plug domain-containing protein [Lacunisphaera sp.]|nr:TonB-dependent receptor plug domain-containing protein [Lacunisphaera sp.]